MIHDRLIKRQSFSEGRNFPLNHAAILLHPCPPAVEWTWTRPPSVTAIVMLICGREMREVWKYKLYSGCMYSRWRRWAFVPPVLKSHHFCFDIADSAHLSTNRIACCHNIALMKLLGPVCETPLQMLLWFYFCHYENSVSFLFTFYFKSSLFRMTLNQDNYFGTRLIMGISTTM